jgi:hypothetical protein
MNTSLKARLAPLAERLGQHLRRIKADVIGSEGPSSPMMGGQARSYC